jgi:hypothetical protein
MRILPSLAQLLGQALVLTAIPYVQHGSHIGQTSLKVFMFLIEPMSSLILNSSLTCSDSHPHASSFSHCKSTHCSFYLLYNF